jgi:hypothetical protein
VRETLSAETYPKSALDAKSAPIVAA